MAPNILVSTIASAPPPVYSQPTQLPPPAASWAQPPHPGVAPIAYPTPAPYQHPGGGYPPPHPQYPPPGGYPNMPYNPVPGGAYPHPYPPHAAHPQGAPPLTSAAPAPAMAPTAPPASAAAGSLTSSSSAATTSSASATGGSSPPKRRFREFTEAASTSNDQVRYSMWGGWVRSGIRLRGRLPHSETFLRVAYMYS